MIRSCTEMTENTQKAWDFMLMKRPWHKLSHLPRIVPEATEWRLSKDPLPRIQEVISNHRLCHREEQNCFRVSPRAPTIGFGPRRPFTLREVTLLVCRAAAPILFMHEALYYLSRKGDRCKLVPCREIKHDFRSSFSVVFRLRGRPCCIVLCFTALRRYCVFHEVKVCGHPALTKSNGTIFPAACAHCVSPCQYFLQ
uniref:uncharacterized protein CFAP90 isoform X1 n=1 Tax=Callithrix jacchus TaxID=9483 RepID=UPI0023DCEBD4|nr:uncharacterized protein CFAP90 isoform X1 [Callithrix jacchus]